MLHRFNPLSSSLSDTTGPAREAPRPLVTVVERDGGTIIELLPSTHRVRCMELGLIPGARVVILKGGPTVLLSVNGHKLALSREFLTGIMITPHVPSPPK